MEKYRTSEKNGHKEAGERVKVSLNVKIFIHLFVLLLAALGSFALLSVFNLGRYTGVIEEADRQRSEIIDKDITGKMQEVATYDLLEYVEAAARIIDREFWSMKHDIELLADSAAGMLEYPEYYNPAEIDPPDPGGSGKLDSYVLYSPDADLTDEAMMSDLHLLANLCPMMESIASDKDAVRETIIALPGGASLLADSHPEEKTDENGDPVTFDATTRPFFIGSTMKHDTYFTHSDMDVFEDELEVIVGVPVYVDSKLRAVCGGSRHLSDLEDIIQSIDYSDESRICLVNDAGVMIYSQWDTGELYMGTNETDNLLDSPNEELAD
ncbi:MAG: cache domain-containing protein, partial [Lachnospiraceae bacterium]|nr:cache domain-containing protein [Lachnospiraceae bacterium]